MIRRGGAGCGRKCLAFMAMTLALAGCSTTLPASVQERTIRVNDQERSYVLFVPTHTRTTGGAGRDGGGGSLPLVVALHRFTETGSTMRSMTGFDELAEAEGFVVAYPDGPGRRFEAFSRAPRDDVAFILSVIDDICSNHPIDTSRVYVCGASNGGFMTHALACVAPHRFAAAAAVMALAPAQPAEDAAENPGVPMLLMHGTKDSIVPMRSSRLFAGRSVRVLAFEESVAYWVKRNGCNIEPETRSLPDLDPSDGTQTTVRSYRRADGRVGVCVYEVKGAGHTWPGGSEPVPGFIVGRTARDFSATQAIWDFFKEHRLSPAVCRGPDSRHENMR